MNNLTNKPKTEMIQSLTREIDCNIDPVVIFEKCANVNDFEIAKEITSNRILLESCEVNTRDNLKSIIVNRSALRIVCEKNKINIQAQTNNGENALKLIESHFLIQQAEKSITINSINNRNLEIIYTNKLKENKPIDEEERLINLTCIDCLRQLNQLFSNTSQDNEYKSFLCGLFSFDLIESFEQLPQVPNSLNDCPDFVFYLAEELMIVDSDNHKVRIFMNVFSGENQTNIFYDLSRKIESLVEQIILLENSSLLEKQSNDKKEPITRFTDIKVNQSDSEFANIVNKLKQEIVDGNIFQVVPSRTFSLKCKNQLASYKKLRESNPSPYLFYMQDEDFTLFGASPESALKYKKSTNSVELYPIAGTRGRGKHSDGSIDHDLDKRLEIDLKLDQKELSEHMMLVDLARNDIARISQHNSIEIPRLLEIDRYSQVMHLVSCVKGQLKTQLDCFHAYQACMNMGTLTGAPKIKATELIRKTEGFRRGSYGGAVGYINSFGDMDTCIVIRSAYCKDGIAHIQAGAGVVYDSDPVSEAQETKQKAQAVINAIQQTNDECIQ